MEVERLTIEQEQEVERLMALAHLQRMRGQIRDAEDTCRKALEVSPRDMKIREELGDILLEEGKLAMALSEYRDALAISNTEALEKKFARVTLEIGEAEHDKMLAEDMIRNPQKYHGHIRNPVWAVVSSLIVPGLGQLYNGQTIKAGIIFGAVALFMFAYGTLQRYPKGIQTTAEFFYFTNPLVMVLGILAAMAYIYGAIDAPFTSDKLNKAIKDKSAKTPPPLDLPS